MATLGSSTFEKRRGFTFPRLGLVGLLAPLLAVVEAQRVLADEGRGDRREALTTAAGQEEAKRSFLDKYRAASARLEAGLARLHGKGRFREFRRKDQRPGEWTTLEFFVDSGKLRVEREYGSAKSGSTAWPLKQAEAILLTPDTAAKVIDPRTEFAWAQYLSDKPDRKLEHEVDRTVWRFLHASYCFGAAPLNEHLQDGSWSLERVERDPTNNGWLHLSCRFISQREGSSFITRGTADVWLDDAQDFLIRKAKSASNFFETTEEVGAYMRVGNGGWLPRAYSLIVSKPIKADEKPKIEPRPYSERIEFEIFDDVETAGIPDSYFTLKSLGINDGRGLRRLWLFLSLSGATLLAAILALRKWRTNRGSAVAFNGGVQAPEESS